MPRRHLPLRHALALTTAFGLVSPALAQSESTPPARVGQITGINGGVSYNGASSNGSWVAATDNYPLITGDSLFTQDGARASIALDASRLTLAPQTELQVTALDDEDFSATESQGELFLDLTALQPGQNYSIATPRGTVTMNQAGMYDIEAGDSNDPTIVNVLSGAASAGGTQIPAGQALYLSGTDQTTAQLGAVQRDDFLSGQLASLNPPPPPYAPPAVMQMTGVSELSNYGSWAQSPQYGAVWYPNVESGWAPYHDGHWAYVSPWGWTWVEAEPWGFAPFHYGRWAQIDGRWGWVPVAYDNGAYVQASAPPVYAPAVVGFFGIGLAAGITMEALSHGSIGWVPLGPGEPYYPHYHADPAYIQRINRIDVRNINVVNIHNNTVITNYANRRAAYYAPASAFSQGRPVRDAGHPMTPQMFGQARPVGHDANFNQAIQPHMQRPPAQAPHPTAFETRHDIPHPQFQPGAPQVHGAQPHPEQHQQPQHQQPEGGAFHQVPQQHPEQHQAAPDPGAGWHAPQPHEQAGGAAHQAPQQHPEQRQAAPNPGAGWHAPQPHEQGSGAAHQAPQPHPEQQQPPPHTQQPPAQPRPPAPQFHAQPQRPAEQPHPQAQPPHQQPQAQHTEPQHQQQPHPQEHQQRPDEQHQHP